MINQEKPLYAKISENTSDMQYFRLNPECYIVRGIAKGAIYNLLSGDIISLDAVESRFLQRCEENKSIEDAALSSEISLIKALEILQQKEKKDIGKYYAQPVYIDKYRDRQPKKIANFFRETALLEYAFLELTNNCYLNCYFCKESMNARREVCMGCSRWDSEKSGKLNLTDWEKILSQLSDLGCAILILTGGDPLLVDCDFSDFIKIINNLNFRKIFLITNGTKLSEENISLLQKCAIHPIIQIFSHEREIHETITGKQGSFDKQISNLEKLKSMDIKFSLSLIALPENQDHINETMIFYQKFSPQQISLNLFYPGYDNTYHASYKFIDKLFITKEKIPKTSLKDFFHKRWYDSCLFGKLAVTSSGKILPCLGMRNEVIGNAKNEILSDLFIEGKFDQYWEISKEKIKHCRDCEFMYACNTCRLIEKNATGSLFDRKFCTYDPSIGKWNEISQMKIK